MNTARIATLATTAPMTHPSTTADILVVLGWLILAAAMIIVVAFFVRKKLLNAADEPTDPTAFTMSDLRRLKAAGQITDAEFARTKAALIARSLAEMDAAAKNRKTPGGGRGPSLNQFLPTDDDSDNQNNSVDGLQ